MYRNDAPAGGFFMEAPQHSARLYQRSVLILAANTVTAADDKRHQRSSKSLNTAVKHEHARKSLDKILCPTNSGQRNDISGKKQRRSLTVSGRSSYPLIIVDKDAEYADSARKHRHAYKANIFVQHRQKRKMYGHRVTPRAVKHYLYRREQNKSYPRNIARATRKIGAKLIHISTDYVFDGTGSVPYTETMEKKPLGVYGVTKAAGEDAVEKEMTQYYILRTAWLYGFDGKNFVYTMTKLMNDRDALNVVSDQKGTPTCAMDLAAAIIKIIETSDKAPGLFGKKSAIPYGVYHFTNLGETTWFEFARRIYELGKKYARIQSDCSVNPCTTEEYPTPAKRPAYSVLDKSKIQNAFRIKNCRKWLCSTSITKMSMHLLIRLNIY